MLPFSPNSANAISSTGNAGGNEAERDTFSPQNATISTGDSVTLTNPSKLAEPHTVTILKDENLFPPLVAAFSIPNNTEIIPTEEFLNVEPIVSPHQLNPNNKLVIMDNARASSTVVIDTSEENVTYPSPNANYTFTGSESFVNSGWLWPEGQMPPGDST